jgi:chromosome segregation ATPase
MCVSAQRQVKASDRKEKLILRLKKQLKESANHCSDVSSMLEVFMDTNITLEQEKSKFKLKIKEKISECIAKKEQNETIKSELETEKQRTVQCEVQLKQQSTEIENMKKQLKISEEKNHQEIEKQNLWKARYQNIDEKYRALEIKYQQMLTAENVQQKDLVKENYDLKQTIISLEKEQNTNLHKLSELESKFTEEKKIFEMKTDTLNKLFLVKENENNSLYEMISELKTQLKEKESRQLKMEHQIEEVKLAKETLTEEVFNLKQESSQVYEPKLADIAFNLHLEELKKDLKRQNEFLNLIKEVLIVRRQPTEEKLKVLTQMFMKPEPMEANNN